MMNKLTLFIEHNLQRFDSILDVEHEADSRHLNLSCQWNYLHVHPNSAWEGSGDK